MEPNPKGARSRGSSKRRSKTTSKPARRKLAVIGGTGELGFGLAVRLANAYSVTIGSRDQSRAAAAAEKASNLAQANVEWKANEEAAGGCDVAILAVPDLPSAGLLSSLAMGLENKLVISPIVPMVFNKGLFLLASPEESAAERVSKLLPASRVAAAFHTVPAPKLARLEEELAYDVLVAAETRDVYVEAADVVRSVGHLRPLYAGPLSASRLVEGITPALINAAKLNKLDSPSIRLV